MSTFVRAAFFLSLLLGSSIAEAQWGTQATALHYERLTGRNGMNWTAGISRDVSERSTIGIDLIGQLNIFESENSYKDVAYAGYMVNYTASRKVIGLQYRSTFFVGRNNSGFYLGPYVGFRSVSRPIQLQYVYPTSNSGPGPDTPSWARSSTTNAMIFPIGLRMGVRSEMDGFFGDLYMAIGTQVGAGNEKKVPEYISEKDELKGFSFQVGYAIGIGWY